MEKLIVKKKLKIYNYNWIIIETDLFDLHHVRFQAPGN